jgi:sugar/nucleoside kinase (ribokinase family)
MVEDDTFWKNVCHFHSDSRQTDAALLLAREAKRRNILVSLDVEKDRETSALDELLIVSDIIFTNALQIDEYLSKLNHQAEQREGRMPIHEATIAFEGDDEGIDLDKSDGLLKDLVDALRPSTYFTRWFGQKDKEVVITKGNKGSIHVVCRSISIESGIRDDYNGTKDYHEVRLSCPRKNDDGEVVMTAKQRFVDPTTSKRKSEDSQSKHRIVNALYEIRSVGIWPDITSIVDTTGAGDAFLGGYLSALWWSRRHGYEPTAHDCLRVGTWVAAKKIEGPGSRTTLPTRDHLDVELGPAPKLAFSTLRKKIGPFGGKSLKPTQVKAKS